MVTISVRDEIEKQLVPDKTYCLFPFYRDGVPFTDGGPQWGMSLRRAGSMRFRWNEINENRSSFLTRLCGTRKPVSVELIHSKKVYAVSDPSDTAGLQGDGLITQNRLLVPVVTVADCMPIFIFDPVSSFFGVLHSGWKGTGIAEQALLLAKERFGTCAENCSVVLGPHIQSCCYTVDEQRAHFFRETFTPDCVTEEESKKGVRLFRLSLRQANYTLLKRIGVKEENILGAVDCTSCTKDAHGSFPFGSFRRQTAMLPADTDQQTRTRSFTVQAAFSGWF